MNFIRSPRDVDPRAPDQAAAIVEPQAPGPAHDRPAIPDHTLLCPIGAGSYGEVWMARNAVGTRRAVKIVHRRSFERADHFEREFKGLVKFEPLSRSHDGLVDVLHLGRNDAAGYFYYVMELADSVPGSEFRVPSSPAGQQLETRNPELEAYAPHTLRSDLRRRGPLPPAECVALGLKLTAALEHLHVHGLVHRDIKPSNIIFVEGVPKLADIGLVTAIDEAQSLVGTVGYIPPEGPGAPQADLYSLGKVLYEISLGKDRQDFPQLPPNLSSHPEYPALLEVNEVILKACENDPRRRYPSAKAMQADLALVQSGLSIKRLRGVERRLALMKRTGMVGTTLLAITTAGLLYQHLQTRRVERERRTAEQLLYAADMGLAQQALEAGNLVRATTLLEAHRPGSKSEIRNPKSEIGPDLRGFEWYYLKNLCRGDEAHTFRGHTQAVRCVAISPDGKLLASGSSDQTIRLWDLASKSNVATLHSHRGAVNAVAFSPDGTMLASGGADQSVKLWAVPSWKVVGDLTNQAYAVTAVAFTPDGKRLALSTEGASLKLWDIQTGQQLHDFGVDTDFAALVVSANGQYLAVGGSDFRVHLWDLSTFQPSPELYEEAGASWSMAFSPDSRMLATARSDGVFLWDLAQRRVAARLRGHEAEVHCVRFSPDGKTLASAAGDNTIRLWDLASRQPIRILKGHQNRVWTLAFSPDGQTLVSGSWDHDIKLWELSPKTELDVLRGHTDAVNCVAFSPDDCRLASASLDGTVKLWEVSRATNTLTLNAHPGGATGVVFSHDGAALASCGLDKTVRFWNSATGEQLAAFPREKQLSCLALSPDGRTLAVGSGWWTEGSQTVPADVTFWDFASRQRLANPIGLHEMVQTLSFSPNGKTLAVGMADDSVEFVDVASRSSLFLSTNLSCVAAWSLADGTLAVADAADQIAIFDITKRRISRWLQMPSAAERYMACSPDGKTMAIFYTTTKIKLCHVATGREVATLQGHTGFGMHLAFSHDGQTLASAGNDRTVRLWRAPTTAGLPMALNASANR